MEAVAQHADVAHIALYAMEEHDDRDPIKGIQFHQPEIVWIFEVGWVAVVWGTVAWRAVERPAIDNVVIAGRSGRHGSARCPLFRTIRWKERTRRMIHSKLTTTLPLMVLTLTSLATAADTDS